MHLFLSFEINTRLNKKKRDKTKHNYLSNNYNHA